MRLLYFGAKSLNPWWAPGDLRPHPTVVLGYPVLSAFGGFQGRGYERTILRLDSFNLPHSLPRSSALSPLLNLGKGKMALPCLGCTSPPYCSSRPIPTYLLRPDLLGLPGWWTISWERISPPFLSPWKQTRLAWTEPLLLWVKTPRPCGG